jgi:hypothetical protein
MIVEIMRPFLSPTAIGRKTGGHPRIKSEGMLVLIAFGCRAFCS